jgi:hypothetical protein
MSVRAKDFLEEWVRENIQTPGYQPERDTTAAAEYAEDCLKDAAEKGISKDEIGEEVGNIVTFISKSIEKYTDSVVERAIERDDRNRK